MAAHTDLQWRARQVGTVVQAAPPHEVSRTAEPFTPAWFHWPVVRQLRVFFVGFGQPPEMTERQWFVLLAVSVAGFFHHMDSELFPVTLRQIQSDLSIPEDRLGLVTSAVQIGRAAAFFVTVSADHVGRRVVFFWCVVVYTLLTLLSALQTSVFAFVVLQLLARTFLTTEGALAQVYLVEEMQTQSRGVAMGIFSSVSVIGPGVLLILFGIVGQWPHGWRYLFALGAVQLPLLPFLWRSLPESEAFERVVALDGAKADKPSPLFCGMYAFCCEAIHPIALLCSAYPGRMTVCLWVSFWNGFAYTPSDVLKIKHLQDERGLTPAWVSVLVIVSGIASMLIFPILGRLGDRKGRRFLMTFFYSVGPLGVLAFYNAPGRIFLIFYPMQLMCGFALMVLSSTFFSELFPSSSRCTANGAQALAAVLGGVGGLACESAVYRVVGTHHLAISVVLLPAFMAPLLVHCCLPETSGRSLDEIAPERGMEVGRCELELGAAQPSGTEVAYTVVGVTSSGSASENGDSPRP